MRGGVEKGDGQICSIISKFHVLITLYQKFHFITVDIYHWAKLIMKITLMKPKKKICVIYKTKENGGLPLSCQNIADARMPRNAAPGARSTFQLTRQNKLKNVFSNLECNLLKKKKTRYKI